MINGVINVYKEKGFTSHDVVAKLRGILKQKKIGHTGTLDPDAVGVLPVCLGSGTRMCDMLTDKSKIYETVLLLGITTDTQDASGKVLSERAVALREEQVREVIAGFIGDYEQIPPMYSAIKINGKKLYELARAGREIERPARSVQIEQIEILSVDLPRVTMRVFCSRGTYIRTLCADIGERLGCGGCMTFLERTRSGQFTKEGALTLAQIETLRDNNLVETAVIPVDRMFSAYEAVTVKSEFVRLAENGNRLLLEQIRRTDSVKDSINVGDQVRVYDENNKFYGIYEMTNQGDALRPFKMFLER